MTEQHPEEGLEQTEFEQVPDESEQLDQDPFQPDYSLDDRGVDDALDEGLTPPEHWSALERTEDETLDQRLSEEVPDTAAVDETAAIDETGAVDETGDRDVDRDHEIIDDQVDPDELGDAGRDA